MFIIAYITLEVQNKYLIKLKERFNMKDTRKLSVIYFVISLIMLLMVAFGCERNSVDYVHSVGNYDVYYVETNNPDYVEKVADKLKTLNDNFIIQSDFGIIEVENGEIVYNNIK